ncbi:hypothetical protein ABZ478_20110 [Streptomyces sp. NPDC005706]|uniref:hypothetical protein n=1 Tax=Streptomyces sp. NPDC005706 TaxID=3157169 RepID=UPI0033EF1086
MQVPVLVEVDSRARSPWITWFTDCATNAITGVDHARASVAGVGVDLALLDQSELTTQVGHNRMRDAVASH